MRNYRILRNVIVSNEELHDEITLGKIENFNKNLSINLVKAKINFNYGIMTTTTIERVLSKSEGKKNVIPTDTRKSPTIQFKHSYLT